ncbi:DUF881 domain-containing protein [Propioniciclava soli]|uniref:DUF881 domain-containing protein n=1 Tax=Propioniciclava soli TaxID=2775081 RepID=A0ABZ3CBW7_9ACTN
MPEAPGPVTWRELGRDLLRPRRGQLVVGLILFACGFALTVQLSGADEQRYSSLRQSELVAVLDDVTAETRRLEADIAQLENTRAQLISGADASDVARDQAERRLEALRILGGTVPVTGPGILVVIDDPQRKVTTEIMLNTIEELRDAGAEVIEVNDQVRLVASSWVGTADGGLVVDGVRLTPPYRIEAIGDPQTLAEATRFRGGLVSTIEGERVQGSVRVTPEERLEIGSVVTPHTPQFARPA